MEPTTQLSAALAGRYEIERELGAGGMATVYLARDVRNKRRVALKVLRPELGAVLGPERFLSEIQVTANLQHPHLLPLFDSGEADGLLYYVMPFVDGENLRQQLDRVGQLPVDDALRIAVAVASALEYAHQHGVIHRDLKPENILLHAGEPVVADFGIAIAVSNAGGARLTQTGISLGTPGYMSPEQAVADRLVDARADIYSLGVVLYEMLTGEPPHTGKTAQAIIARVLTETPRPIRVTRPSVSAAVEAAVARAMAKLPADRFSSAREFVEALRERAPVATLPPAAGGRRGLLRAVMTVAGGVVLGAAATRWIASGVSPSPGAAAPAVRATIDLAPDAPLALGGELPTIGFNSPVIALSPDGHWMAYVARIKSGSMLYLRDMASGEIRPLPGTEGAIHAFFSPNGQWVGFLTVDHIKKVSRLGGAAVSLCEARTPILGWWLRPDSIYFIADGIGILARVSAEGGVPETVFNTADVQAGGIYDVLPDEQTILASSVSGFVSDFQDVVMIDLRTRQKTRLLRSGYAARYVAPGYVLYAHAGSLMAVRFDAARKQVLGEPVAVASNVAMMSLFGMLHAATSNTGVLAFAAGGDMSIGKIAWVDRHGGVEYLDLPERTYGVVDLAPDESRLAVQVVDVKDYIGIWDFHRREWRRVPNSQAEGQPLWSVDGRRLAGATETDSPTVVIHDVGAGGAIGEGIRFHAGLSPVSWSPKGDALAILESVSPFRIRVAAIDPSAIAPSGGRDFFSFSPDGKWMAVEVSSGGNSEIVIESYPEGKVVGQVSTDGGIEERWKPSGELFYRNGHRWSSTRVTTTPFPHWERPQLAFDTDFIDTPGVSYDVSRDGQRLLVVKQATPIATSRIELVSNWAQLLERR